MVDYPSESKPLHMEDHPLNKGHPLSVREHGLADLKASMSSSYPYDDRYAADKMKQQADESISISRSVKNNEDYYRGLKGPQ